MYNLLPFHNQGEINPGKNKRIIPRVIGVDELKKNWSHY